jgi:inorganic pyrophosphatase
MDGGGIDVWRGALAEGKVTGVIVTIDLLKRDAEIKLLVGCTAGEAVRACAVHNQGGQQAGILMMRPEGEG